MYKKEKEMKKVSIIIPAYNEEESLPLLYDRLSKVILSLKNYEFELLFIIYIIGFISLCFAFAIIIRLGSVPVRCNSRLGLTKI